MASGTRFEYSHETHTCRIPEAVTRAKFCQSIIDTKNKYGFWKTKDYEILRSASQIEIVNCLNDIWQAVRK